MTLEQIYAVVWHELHAKHTCDSKGDVFYIV